MKVVISQPMFFPWVGMLEQVRLADVYVHYSDVQFSKGSFVNRVQIKHSAGTKWLTVPLESIHLGQRIDEVCVNERHDWRRQHLGLLRQAYDRAPFRDEMLSLASSVYDNRYSTIGELAKESLMSVCAYYGLNQGRRFVSIDRLNIAGKGSQRVLEIVRALGGDRYVTGLGARHYLDHAIFENAGVRVEYMNYRQTRYPQLHGAFTPYVSALDLVANTGRDGGKVIQSTSVYWKDFLANG